VQNWRIAALGAKGRIGPEWQKPGAGGWSQKALGFFVIFGGIIFGEV
jgi:hypothetical protein